jgi:hypothetical protein
MTTPEQRAEWHRLCDAATEGPWRASVTYPAADMVIHAKGVPQQLAYLAVSTVYEFPVNENAAFISAAREALPALLAENEKLRSAIEQLHGPLSIAALGARAEAAEAERDRLREKLSIVQSKLNRVNLISTETVANDTSIRSASFRALRRIVEYSALEQK